MEPKMSSYFTKINDKNSQCVMCGLLVNYYSDSSRRNQVYEDHLQQKHPDKVKIERRRPNNCEKVGKIPIKVRKLSYVRKYYNKIDERIMSCKLCGKIQSTNVDGGLSISFHNHLAFKHGITPDTDRENSKEAVNDKSDALEDSASVPEESTKAEVDMDQVKIGQRYQRPKSSHVWKYFDKSNNDLYCICKICGK